MRQLTLLFAILLSLAATAPAAASPASPHSAPPQPAAVTPMQVYGAWHCSNDACTGRPYAPSRSSTAKTTG
jgi:hypothetical protein